MTSERWEKVAQLFETAVVQPADERAAFLDNACGRDDALRRDVEGLLASDSGQERPFAALASELAAGWATESASDDLLGRTLGRYRILSRLGSGGMGEVFLAQDTMLQRKTALKLLPRQFTRDADRLRRFEQEARAASALNHPNIITIYEIGEAAGTRFIATELVEGKTLGDWIGETRLGMAEILKIGAQAAGALAAAHEAGIVHRDIKPANIMWRRDGFVKVLDFGLAKLADDLAPSGLTEPGRVMGTIHYMSPEQAMGKPVDHRTDIFSLGVVLYELAAGRRLFEGPSAAAVYDAILHQSPPPLPESIAIAPAEFDQVVRRALAKDPARRYQTALELRDDLERLAQGLGTTVAAKIAAREQRVARRSKILRWAGIATGIAAVILGGLVLDRTLRPAPQDDAQKSLAVLPFDTLGGEQEHAHFADGVQDQVLTNLTRIADLKVISRTSVMQYRPGQPRALPEIGRALRVAYLLEGTVQRAQGHVRVNVQLTHASTTAQIWSHSYERDLPDVFALQTEIAKAIANELRATLLPAEKAAIERPPTADMAAFDLYTRGKTLVDAARVGDESAQDMSAGVALLEQAVARDPTFYVAYCTLARAQSAAIMYGFGDVPTRLASARAAVAAAQRLAPDAGDTHLAAAVCLYASLDHAPALAELELAEQKLPHDPRVLELRGYIERRRGRWQESTRDLERASEFDPLHPILLQELSSNYEALHRYEDWAASCDRFVALRPGAIGPRLTRARVDLEGRGDTRRLRAEVQDQIRQGPAAAKRVVSEWIKVALFERDYIGLANALATLGDGRYGSDWAHFSRRFGEGMLARMNGDDTAARAAFAADRVTQERIVQEQPDHGPAISMLGLIDAALGRKEEALREGRRAVELLPAAKDSIRGVFMIQHLAIIAAWVGEKDLALEQLRLFASLLPAGPPYGPLKLDPMWDPLRGDPRFEELLASVAPKGEKED